MTTPSGRFKPNTRLCLSISDYHPDTWNPAWSVGTILTGLLSFMLEKSPTLGSIETSEAVKRRFAVATHEFNLQNKVYLELFPGMYTQYGPIKNGRIKNQHSDFEKNKEPVVRILGLKNRFAF